MENFKKNKRLLKVLFQKINDSWPKGNKDIQFKPPDIFGFSIYDNKKYLILYPTAKNPVILLIW